MSIYQDKIAIALGITPLSRGELKILFEDSRGQFDNNVKIGPVYSPFRDDPNYDFVAKNFWNSSSIEKINSMKKNLSEKTKEQFEDPILKRRHMDAFLEADGNHKNKIWITKDKKNKRVTIDVYLSEYLDWDRGRYIPPETGFGTYDKNGNNNPFFGKKHTKETKMKISEAKKGKL